MCLPRPREKFPPIVPSPNFPQKPTNGGENFPPKDPSASEGEARTTKLMMESMTDPGSQTEEYKGGREGVVLPDGVLNLDGIGGMLLNSHYSCYSWEWGNLQGEGIYVEEGKSGRRMCRVVSYSETKSGTATVFALVLGLGFDTGNQNGEPVQAHTTHLLHTYLLNMH